MTDTILRTKLYRPSSRPNLVLRPQLLERLDKGLRPGSKLILVSAPAGFGKTTVVGEWARRCEQPVAWLSLEEGENDLRRFLTYLVASVQTTVAQVGQGLLAVLQSAETIDTEAVLTMLLNEMNDIPNEIVIVLDDYHLIESQPVDRALIYLLDHLPPTMHLILVSRIDPSLPLARLRASGQMVEVRAQELRFSAEETVFLLNQQLGFDLSQPEISALHKHTEGWIAGLQLAALSIQGLRRGKEMTNFVSRFTGSDHYIQDYLVDEVLQQRPEGTRDFLLKTSILRRLSAPLCNAVMEKPTSQAVLERLDAANLFIVSLDSERRWYRYHHLFADLLEHRLQQTLPDEIPQLHLRACDWYEKEGYLDEAIRHAHVAGAVERVVEILEDQWQNIVHQGKISDLRKLLESVGPKRTSASMPLSMAYCWVHVFNGRNDLISPHIEDIRSMWTPGHEGAIDQPMKLAVIPSLVETMAASVALHNRQPGQAKTHAQQAIALIPAKASPTTRQLLHGAAGYRLALACQELGEYDRACELLLGGLEMLKASENYLGMAATLLQIVTLYQKLGATDDAVALCNATHDYLVAQGWEKTPPGGLLKLLLADLQADSGQFESANKNLESGRHLVESINSLAIHNLVTTVERKAALHARSRETLAEPLSPREVEVLQLAAKGLSNREISERLVVALDTVKGHNRNIYGKLGARNRTQAINKALSLKIISR